MIGRIAFVAALVASGHAFAAEPVPRHICKPIKEVKASFPADTMFTMVTPGQLNFLRGIAALNPQTPPGIPPGNGAVIVQKKGKSAGGAVVFFVKGNTYCTPMVAPDVMMKMIIAIPTGKTDDEGAEL